MADRSLRGMRLGSQSLQSEEGVVFSPRSTHTYHCTNCGHDTDMVFSADAEVPEVWESPKSGLEGRLLTADGKLVEIDEADVKVPRSHWDMLLERRTRDELEELLQERLTFLRARRGQEKIGA